MAIDAAPRRRRAPDEARQEILSAARDVLTSGPGHEFNVAAIMARTTLTRKSFYVYYRDRAELLAEMVTPLRTDTDADVEQWRTANDPTTEGRAALASAARTYREHNAILRAVLGSSDDSPDLVRAREALVEPVAAAAEATIEALAPGRFRDPRRVAVALVTMNVHTLLRLTPDTPDDELNQVVETLAAIWEATLGVRGT